MVDCRSHLFCGLGATEGRAVRKYIYKQARVLFITAVFASSLVFAQAPPASRALTILPPTGLPIIPVMEGWYDNEDGSVTISFGYHNKNTEGSVVAPLGEGNRIEPAEFDGVQPTYFDRGRHTGVFAITLPEARRKESVWWYIKTGENEVYKVPGRASAEAYQLDRRPRPQGSVAPVVWFDERGERSSGLAGPVMARKDPVGTGSPVLLTIHALDPSERNRDDPRFRDPIPLWVNWSVHQGPAAVEFTRHESTFVPEPDDPDAARLVRRTLREATPEYVTLPDGSGTANIYATFAEPGEYLLRIQVDNWAAPDSAEEDQCCWTNAYLRIAVVDGN